MATSGTVGQTTVTTDRILEHAMLRVGLTGPQITPKIIQLAQENLFFLLLNLSARGVNLWLINKYILGLNVNQAEYILPTGTIDVMPDSVVFSQSKFPTQSVVNQGTSSIATMNETTPVMRYGFIPAATFTAALTVTADGGATVDVLPSQQWVGGQWYWYDADPNPTTQTLTITSNAVTFSLTQFLLSNNQQDQIVSPFNRNDYVAQPTKWLPSGGTVTNFWFQKFRNPTLTVWPVMNKPFTQLTMWIHHQIQDVGSLTQELDIPNRWLDAVIWLLAQRLCEELSDVDPTRVARVNAQCDKIMPDAEHGESDGQPLRIRPGIRAYTRGG